ncbi:Rne/Rng family ribonuclease [Bacillus sp. FJAT-50079]|uniref:Rne/Rng family ribonuclease n=1 Tax=Bacillus sp. FJAT-50079 TaxID=2833577 RepID=UPI001BC9EB8A|nr:Rne/Rng family ribonuclease [Bacillus sp. FJAT-50079]MBS4208967.1 Rne/Rng family ribonuclease [Bacillus sp. FJAT-50079]
MNEIYIDLSTEQKRFVVKEQNTITTIFVEQPQDRSKVGNIYLGRVESVKPGMDAAFVTIDDGKNGFLKMDQLPAFLHAEKAAPISSYLREGEQILVQVKKDETDEKGPLLSAIIEFSNPRIVYMPEGKYISISRKASEKQRKEWKSRLKKQQQGREGFIIRTEALNESEETLIHDMEGLREEWARLLEQVKTVKSPALVIEQSNFEVELHKEVERLKGGTIIALNRAIIDKISSEFRSQWKFQQHLKQEPLFSYYNLEIEIEKAQSRIVLLDEGAYLVIDETEAAVIIDVNTGQYTGRQLAADTVLKTNITAAKEIARQLRVRDYGGMILIDFINMTSSLHRQQVLETLKEAVKQDPKHIRLRGFTQLGIFELTRARTKQSLSKAIQTTCSVCHGTGMVKSPEAVAFSLERELLGFPKGEFEAVLIECDQATRNAFTGKNNEYVSKLEEFLQLRLYFKQTHFCKPEYYIRRFGTNEEIKRNVVDT